MTKVIVGLGNPGERYSRNRHNVGFLAVEAMAREAAGSWSDFRLFQACRVEFGGFPVILVKPATYMNHSGKAVHVLLSELQRSPQDLLLIVDDLNLPFGRIRLRQRGTAGGHHGLESILNTLETEEVMRLRLGIGEESMPGQKADFVLEDFPTDRQAELDEMIVKACNAVKSILNNGVAKTMALFNA